MFMFIVTKVTQPILTLPHQPPGLQRSLRPFKLHSTPLRVPGPLPGPLLRQPQRRRPPYHAPDDRFQEEGN